MRSEAKVDEGGAVRAPGRAAAWRRALARGLVAAGAVVLGLVLFLSNGALHGPALGGVTFATLAALAALLLWRGAPAGEGGPAGRRWTLGILWVGIAASFAIDASYLPGVYVDPAALTWFRPMLGAFGVLVATHAVTVPPRLARVRFGLELAAAAALGAIVIRASPVPLIDVWYMEQMGASALLRGANPYAIAYPNIYGPLSGFISGALLSPDRTLVLAFPYTPLTLLLVAPATALTSEPRWTMLIATLLSAWAVRRLGRGSAEASLAAVFLLVQPRGLFVMEQAWTEPLMLAGTLAVALLAVRHDEGAARDLAAPARPGYWLPLAIVGSLALGTKQYSPLVLLPLLLVVPRPARLRAAAVAVAGALAVALPFVIWDPPAFFRGVIRFQLLQPFRPDALSWPAALVRYAGLQPPPTWPAFLLAGALLLWACRPPVSIARALTASAGAWLVFVVLNKQAFCNYYWLAAGLLCAAVAAGSRGGEAVRARRSEG